jgi:hypothetical protein
MGQTVHTRGWNAGIEVRAFVDLDGRDAFSVFATSGSNGDQSPRQLGVLKDSEEDGPVFLPARGFR